MEEKDVVLKNRVKSLLWRAGMMLLAVVLSVIVESLSRIEVSTTVFVISGLVLGELSKIINVNYQLEDRAVNLFFTDKKE